MATIRTAIQLQDGMTSVIRPMINALNICTSSFEAMQNASNHAVNTANISAARAELSRASIAMNTVEQEIREADAAQKQLNNDIHQGQAAASGLAGSLKNAATAIITAVGANKVIKLSDTVAQTTARLDLMNDKQQTTVELQEKIFQSAERARGVYQSTADAVSKLGMQAAQAFSSNDELIAFAEQLNKTFVIAGASAVGVDSVMLQLTQSMAAGKLQGEELNAVLDNAQPIVANIQRYLQNVQGFPKSTTDNIKQLASDGVITAQIIKNAMFYAADETNAKFAAMPKTFGQVWNSVENRTLKAFQPVLQMINTVANSKGFESLVTGGINAVVTLGNVAAKTFNEIAFVSGVVANNWSMLAPIVWGSVAAYAAYKSAVIGVAVVEGISNSIKLAGTLVSYARSAALGTELSATAAATAAQWGLNTAILACPVTWIVVGIIAITAVIYLAVAAVNKFAGTSYSATGIIMGSFYALGNFIMNIIIFLINSWISFVEFFINVFDNPLYSTKQLFVSWGNGILDIVSTIASAIDKVFGTNMKNAVTSLKSQMSGWVGEMPNNYKVLGKLQMTNLDEAYKSAYDVGNQFANRFDLSKIGSQGFDLGLDLSKFGNDMASTAANTGKMKDSLDISEEDLKYMRDVAEQEVINRYTTAQIKVEMGGVQNTVSSNVDLDGMMTYFKDTLIETMQTAAEGVHE
ncbi:tape measure domain-containing protein [Anaerospora hongkongensis]|uniref:Tape measure domain-containing protein n=1 Tax=Anaerospora hongkongensis TaxID=244830 RepID=A0A4R1PUK9_9FIRM|nr:tape measure protein [Anaerospora hongkongensis]TCL35651.1 tape measure domain-containing protein [Anaerospora hongkongensis]